MGRSSRIGKVGLDRAFLENVGILPQQAIGPVGQDAGPRRQAVLQNGRVDIALERDPRPCDRAMALVELPQDIFVPRARSLKLSWLNCLFGGPHERHGRQPGSIAQLEFHQEKRSCIVRTHFPTRSGSAGRSARYQPRTRRTTDRPSPPSVQPRHRPAIVIVGIADMIAELHEFLDRMHNRLRSFDKVRMNFGRTVPLPLRDKTRSEKRTAGSCFVMAGDAGANGHPRSLFQKAPRAGDISVARKWVTRL